MWNLQYAGRSWLLLVLRGWRLNSIQVDIFSIYYCSMYTDNWEMNKVSKCPIENSIPRFFDYEMKIWKIAQMFHFLNKDRTNFQLFISRLLQLPNCVEHNLFRIWYRILKGWFFQFFFQVGITDWLWHPKFMCQSEKFYLFI